MTDLEATRDRYLAEFARVGNDLPGRGREKIDRLRRSALASFAEKGFPTQDAETWRHTDVRPIASTSFKVASGKEEVAPAAGILRNPLKVQQLAFVNGRHAPEFSALQRLPAGVKVGSLAEAMQRDPLSVEPWLAKAAPVESPDASAFVLLNTAFFRDGAFVYVPRGVALEDPIHVLFVSVPGCEPFAAFPRVLVVLEPLARATIVESYVGPVTCALTNAVSEVFLADGASADLYKLQRESTEAYHMASLNVRQGRGTVVASHSISLGAALARNEVRCVLEGEGAESTLNGLYEATGRQLIDNQTHIDHAKPHGMSRQLYKGILDGRARGVFNGQIIVRPDAQKTDAIQTNKNLLLSDEALIHTKPELQIFANDVKCKHGATIGQLDRDVLFYLRSRGIPLETARRLLVHAFASEIVDRIKAPSIRSQLGGCMQSLSGAEPATSSGFEI